MRSRAIMTRLLAEPPELCGRAPDPRRDGDLGLFLLAGRLRISEMGLFLRFHDPSKPGVPLRIPQFSLCTLSPGQSGGASNAPTGLGDEEV